MQYFSGFIQLSQWTKKMKGPLFSYFTYHFGISFSSDMGCCNLGAFGYAESFLGKSLQPYMVSRWKFPDIYLFRNNRAVEFENR